MQNRVKEYQKLYQSKPNTPLWMRSPRSKFLVYPFYALFAFTCVGVPLHSTYRAITGQHYD